MTKYNVEIQLFKEIKGKTSAEIWDKMVKKYPVGTFIYVNCTSPSLDFDSDCSGEITEKDKNNDKIKQ